MFEKRRTHKTDNEETDKDIPGLFRHCFRCDTHTQHQLGRCGICGFPNPIRVFSNRKHRGKIHK